MFPQQPQQQFRTTNANVQLFYQDSTWAKPPGVSQVYMMLIGGGGDSGTTPGGSGAVTTWWGSAQNVPDNLVISVSTGNASNTTVNYRASNGLNALLTANGASLNTAGPAMTANQFCASGFFQSVAGQGGTASQTASTTTFLGGGGSAGGNNIANYGYALTANGKGLFQLQPIIVGLGSAASASIGGAIGCGASKTGGAGDGKGGPGLVIIAAW